MIFQRLVFLLPLLAWGCGSKTYTHDDLVGTWKIVEVKYQKNEMSSTFLGAETMSFSDEGKYISTGTTKEVGQWTILGNRLRLHVEPVTDLKGNIVYEGHDSEWRVGKSKAYMIWRGTKRFDNQSLEVLFEKE